jgi:predicted metal-binding protein
MTEQKIEKVKLDVNKDEIAKNLEKYRKLALEEGASDAKIIKADQVTVDERVKLKCEIPKCHEFGICAHCPPHSMSAEKTRKYLSLYENAVVFKTDVPADIIVSNGEERRKAYREITEICNKLESTAFYNGDYLSVGFGAGSCRDNYCWNLDGCAVLKGKPCVHFYRTRASMESVGIDCFKLATEVGWDILPIGSGAKAENITQGTLMGIVLIN